MRIKKNISSLLFAILLLNFLSTAGIGKENVQKIVKKVQSHFKEAKTAEIQFKEVNKFKLTGIESTMEGTLIFQGMEKFRLETQDQVMVSNGEIFWRYNKLQNQVLIDYAKKNQQEALFNQFLFKISDNYFAELVDEEKRNGKKIFVINLTPKNNDQSFFTKIKVWIEDKSWSIKKIIYTDYNQNETIYEIKKIEINKKIDPKIFQFQVPEGAEVVDLRI